MTSHTDAIDARDIANLGHVRDLFAHADPVPSDLAERVKFAITVHALHAEVAELMDSALLTTRGAEAKVEPTPTESVTFTGPNWFGTVLYREPMRIEKTGWFGLERIIEINQGLYILEKTSLNLWS